jgi:sugar phosphate isomerase/epimerase
MQLYDQQDGQVTFGTCCTIDDLHDARRVAARLGIRRIRLGATTYGPEGWPPDRLKELAPALRDVAAACKDLGLQAGLQNHSGASTSARPSGTCSRSSGTSIRVTGFADIGHATVEAGLSWPVEARLAEPFLTAVMVKDFYWKKEAGAGRTPVPARRGMVDRRFFDWLEGTRYRGPICQHHEYPLGEGEEMLAHLRRDLKVLKEWLA